MAKLIPMEQRSEEVQYKMKEIKRVLGYSQRWLDGLSDKQVHGIYYHRVLRKGGELSKRERARATQQLQALVYEAIVRDEIEVRRRAGLL